MEQFRLEVCDYASPLRWRWLLTEEGTGRALADHQVSLNKDAQEFRAFTDLYRYLWSNAIPDLRAQSEAGIAADIGAWAGREVLGGKVGARIVDAAPVTVRVVVPDDTGFLLTWPLELAHADGTPLAARGDVTLSYDIGTSSPSMTESGPALRMLAVFSLPSATSVLALRRERYELTKLIRRTRTRQRRRVELTVVQYGVTRDKLAKIAEAGDGWDVLHLSGHGAATTFALEKADGSLDRVETDDLVRLLAPLRGRARLAVVSACESGAATTAETLRWSRGQSLGTAMAKAVATAIGPKPSAARPALSAATPILIADQAGVDLVLDAPRGQPDLDAALVRMERFPPEAERFVGRAGPMAQASAALAADSGRTGVLLHGMAGAGKTACAVELAYRHQDSFQAVAFWQAPVAADEFGAALSSLAASLDIQLGGFGFAMSGNVTSTEKIAAFAPRLKRLLEATGILLVLDNLESLLTTAGTWRDPGWEPIVHALTTHTGESRVILTSRIPPTDSAPGLLTLPVHALDLAESVALARELPELRKLLHAEPGPVRAAGSQTVQADRDLVRRVLYVVQGHPKLMELADATAADKDQLTAQLDLAEAITDRQRLGAFFRDGTTDLTATQFLDTLSTWTTSRLATLSEPTQLMARFLACIDEGDRDSWVVHANWGYLWRRLGQPGEPLEPEPLLAALSAAALIQAVATGETVIIYRMHPGVAQAIQTSTSQAIQTATDTELAEFWDQVFLQARKKENTPVVVRAGLAAAPYLLRLKQWQAARQLLEYSVHRDDSPVTTQAALPALRSIADATNDPHDLAVLASVLQNSDPSQAEELLRVALDQEVKAADFIRASASAGHLVNLLVDAGRLREALNLTEQKADYTVRAGLGPLNQLADRGIRLQVLGMMGEHRQVLDQISGLEAEIDALPTADETETVNRWNVVETTLDIGRSSALALGEWQQALDFNARVLAAKEARSDGQHSIAGTRLNNLMPLIELGREAEVGRMLADCQRVFESHQDLRMLAKVFSARAILANRLSDPAAAASLCRTALRYGYLRPEPRELAATHHNLALYLTATRADLAEKRAHRLSAALIFRLIGMTHRLAGSLAALAKERRDEPANADLPSTVAEVIRLAELTEGVCLGDLLAALEPDPEVVEAALAEILN